MIEELRSDSPTIAARATAPGEGAIAIIRISGPACFAVLEHPLGLTRDRVKYGCLNLAHFRDPRDHKIIDQIMYVLFKAPHSYTGEDAAEIHCHGSQAIVSAILETLFLEGARPAEPGEFTRRAFLNGKMDLTRAEAVCDLVHARTQRAARMALRQLRGGLAQRITQIRKILLNSSAEIEARIDYPEEELGETALDALGRDMKNAHNMIQDLITRGRSSRLLQEGARVVLLGRPNTGKSSIFNSLLRMERAIVTAHPGTTRDTIEGTVDLRGCPVCYVDTAGLRKSPNEIESLGIERSKAEARQADLALFLMDMSSPPAPEDLEIYRQLNDIPFLLVLNKCDLETRISRDDMMRFGKGAREILQTSSLTGRGIREMEEAIVRCILGDVDRSEDALTVNERHGDLLRAALEELDSATKGIRERIHDELIMVNLRECLRLLGEITGEEFQEDILDLIFSRFCIGK